MAVRLLGREVEAFVFDVDGTFYNQQILLSIFTQVRLALASRLLHLNGNTQPSQEELASMRNTYVTLADNLGSYTQAFVTLGGTGAEYKFTAEKVDRSGYLSPDPDLRQMLERLNSVASVALFTSTLEEVTKNTCTKLLGADWRGLFQVVMCCDTPGRRGEKPEQVAFEHILEMLGTPPHKAAMVGDLGSADLKIPGELGMLTIQVERTDWQDAHLYIPCIYNLVDHISPLS